MHGAYNLWRGFSVQPRSGSCSIFWQLVKDAICSGSPVLYEYVRRYFAHLIQRPWELPEVSIVLLHANEATWGGSKGDREKLKAMITDPKMPVEMKGLDIIEMENYLRLVISSNEDWPVPIDLDDRRFLVLDVSPMYMQNHAFFSALHAELNNGGREALMHDLTTESLVDFSPRSKPNSPFGADMKIRSADSPTRWLRDFLNDNEWMNSGKVFPQIGVSTEVGKSALFSDYQAWSRNSPDKYAASRDQFFKVVRQILGPSMTDSRPAVPAGQARESKFILSSIGQCRSEFEASTGTRGGIVWDTCRLRSSQSSHLPCTQAVRRSTPL